MMISMDDDDQRHGGDDDDDKVHLEKDSEPLKAFSGSNAGQQPLTGQRWTAGLGCVLICIFLPKVCWYQERYISYFKFAFYRMIGEEVVDGNGTTVGRGSSSETKSKPNEKDWENTPGKN